MFAGDFFFMSCGACCFHRLSLCLQGHLFHTHTLRLTSSNLVRSDVLLRGNIGKPLVLIMLYSHLFPLFCLLITIHSCSVCLCVCVRVLFILRAHVHVQCARSLNNRPHPPPPPQIYEEVNCTGASPDGSSLELRHWPSMLAKWDGVPCSADKK